MNLLIAYLCGYLAHVVIIAIIIRYDDTLLDKEEFALTMALFWPVLWLMAPFYFIIRILAKLTGLIINWGNV